MLFDTLTIVGVGLIGGSVGRAAKAKRIARQVLGLGRNAEFLALAVECGAIDALTINASEAFAAADLILMATPVDRIAEVILENAKACRPGTIITDAGSTKVNVIDALRDKLPKGIEFVGSHPLAGSEKCGVQHARDDLFHEKMVVIVPDAASERAVEKVEAFWRQLGGRTLRMSAEEHDRAVAFTSHLPHAVASATAKILPPAWLPLAASGFRDTTRIAAGDPELWLAIFQANRDAILAAMAKFRDSFDEFEKLLRAGDRRSLIRWLAEGKQVRDALGS